MIPQFRSACAVAAAIIDPASPLNELPLPKLLEWAAACGGRTYRVPTVDEIMGEWEVGRVLSESHELYDLWLAKSRGEDVAPRAVVLALRGVSERLAPELAVKATKVAFTLLLGPEHLKEMVERGQRGWPVVRREG